MWENDALKRARALGTVKLLVSSNELTDAAICQTKIIKTSEVTVNSLNKYKKT